MRSSLRVQVVGLSVGLVAVGVGGLVVWAGYRLQQATIEGSYHELLAKALVLATVLREPLEHGWVDQATVAEYAQTARARVLVLDRSLRLVASSEPGSAPPSGTARQGWAREPSGVRLYATVPVVEDAGRLYGAVELSVPATSVLEPVRRTWRSMAAVGAAVVAAVGLVSALLVGWITRPLRVLTHVAGALASGRLSERVPVEGAEELRRLADTFNRMAEQVQAMVERQRAFAAHAAHELRSPLASLRVRLEILQGRVAEDASAGKLVEDALRGVDRLQRLVDHLLALWAVQETVGPRPGPVDLAPALYELADEVGPLVAQAGLTLEVDVPPHLPDAMADVEQVRLVVRNLLDNAIKHTPHGGRVVLRARPRGDGVELVVQDTGVGIAPEHLPRVFDRFYRVPTEVRGPAGSGLGLALVRELVEAQGGRVEVRSALRKGSEFRVWLPGRR